MNLLKSIPKLPIFHAHLHPRHGLLFYQALEKFLADSRQDSIGENRIYHPPAAFQLRTAADDELDRFVVIRKWYLVVFHNAFLDPAQLQPGDRADHFVT